MGRAWTFGDNIDTDVINPEQYKLAGRDAWREHVLEPIAPDFADEVSAGDVVVAGRNFGAGSSRESAPIGLYDNDVDAVIAASFARIFYRNAINIGLRVYVCPEASECIDEGDEVGIDHDNGIIHNRMQGERYHAEDHPEFIQKIIEAGGLKAYRKQV